MKRATKSAAVSVDGRTYSLRAGITVVADDHPAVKEFGDFFVDAPDRSNDGARDATAEPKKAVAKKVPAKKAAKK